MDKVVIITGSSRGIGAATALRFASQGYKVAINYRRDEAAAQATRERVAALGVDSLAIAADVATESGVDALFRTVDGALGRVSTLVNNAAILQPQGRLDTMHAERINRVMTTNVTGYFLCCREAVKRMSTRYAGPGGTIVNVSSAASRLGAGGEYIDYAASKGAVDTLTLGLASEVAGEGIRVNCVRPGFIYTDMHTDGGEPERVDRLSKSLPLQRGGRAEEVAAAIAWLASDESSYCTGTFIDVAGGR